MRLAVSRAIAIETPRGWRIAKEKQSHKIDVVVALGMAAHAAVKSETESTYIADLSWVGYLQREGATTAAGDGAEPGPVLWQHQLECKGAMMERHGLRSAEWRRCDNCLRCSPWPERYLHDGAQLVREIREDLEVSDLRTTAPRHAFCEVGRRPHVSRRRTSPTRYRLAAARSWRNSSAVQARTVAGRVALDTPAFSQRARVYRIEAELVEQMGHAGFGIFVVTSDDQRAAVLRASWLSVSSKGSGINMVEGLDDPRGWQMGLQEF